MPQTEESLLHVWVHNASRPAANAALEKLFEYLNAAEVCYPGTDMRLFYELISKKFGREVGGSGAPPIFPRGK